ncbi:PEP-CTERM sorting domain-containing protein [Aquincola agrisoli]|uniref:PEP-CTERM sorting domain-containing protein n=1 Tax=Aquincola TaxID=391952 RepID=UPI002FBEDD44
MTKRDSWAMGLVLAATAAFAAPAQANLVTNGSFETADFSGWITTGDSLFNGVQCPGADDSVFAGACSAYFGSGTDSGITQTINVGGAGKTWNLSFAFQPDGAIPSSFSVMFGGQTLLSLTTPAAGGYMLYEFSGLTTGETMTLAFNFVDPVGFLFLDAVSVTAVPEPATMAMMGMGLAGLFVSRRRLRKTA